MSRFKHELEVSDLSFEHQVSPKRRRSSAASTSGLSETDDGHSEQDAFIQAIFQLFRRVIDSQPCNNLDRPEIFFCRGLFGNRMSIVTSLGTFQGERGLDTRYLEYPSDEPLVISWHGSFLDLWISTDQPESIVFNVASDPSVDQSSDTQIHRAIIAAKPGLTVTVYEYLDAFSSQAQPLAEIKCRRKKTREHFCCRCFSFYRGVRRKEGCSGCYEFLVKRRRAAEHLSRSVQGIENFIFSPACARNRRRDIRIRSIPLAYHMLREVDFFGDDIGDDAVVQVADDREDAPDVYAEAESSD